MRAKARAASFAQTATRLGSAPQSWQAWQAHTFPFVVERYVKYEYELQPWFKAMPEEMFAALEKHLG